MFDSVTNPAPNRLTPDHAQVPDTLQMLDYI